MHLLHQTRSFNRAFLSLRCAARQHCQYALNMMTLLPADTGELSEAQLEYAAPQELALSKEQLPDRGWPQPSLPRWPFNGGLVDHCRLVAPGVIVGSGWKGTGRGRHGQEFLKFLMVKKPAQT